MRKKVLYMLALLCAVAQGAWAANDVTYNYLRWDEVDKQIYCYEIRTSNFTTLKGNHPDEWVTLNPDESYVVEGTASYKVLNVAGEYGRIILKTGSTLNVKHIKLEKGSRLIIFEETHEEGAVIGTLNVNNDAYNNAAGIGGGYKADAGDLEIHGGIITAKGKWAAGVGGGKSGDGGNVVIYGGTLNAYGGENAAGIGGGDYGDGGSLYVYGGTVRAEGNSWGSGIGGGNSGNGCDTHIFGGTVTAIAGDDCKARKANCGSAIGCGDDVKDKANIDNAKILEIPDNYKVTGGDSETDIDAVFTADARIDACRWRNYVKIEACPHEKPWVGGDRSEAITYSIDDDVYHTKYCRYCNYSQQEEHSGTSCVCGKTSTYRFTTYQPGTDVDTYVAGSTIAVGDGMDFYLPTCSTVPDGYTFLGWEMNPDPDGGNQWVAVLGDDIMEAGSSVKALSGQDAATFYPRFLYDLNDEWQWNDDYTECTLRISGDALDYSEIVTFTQSDGIVRQYFDDRVEYSVSYTYTLYGYNYEFYTKESVPYVLTLQDNADNGEAIEEYAGKKATVILDGRTLYTDGSWNTICLPFDASDDFDYDFIEIKTLESTEYDAATHTLALNFVEADKMEAGKPYLVRWNFSEEEKETFNLIGALAGVTDEEGNITYWEYEPAFIDNTLQPVETEYVNFSGSFSPVMLTANDKSVLYLGADNTLYYPTANMTVGSCRAIFRLNGITAGDLAQGAKSIVLNFGDGEATGISLTPDLSPKGEGSGYYTLDGRRLSGKPSRKGVYINNGKKHILR